MKNLLCVLFGCLYLSINAQTIDVDQRLVDAFGQEHILFLQKNNPDLISYYSFFLNNAFYFQKIDKEKYMANKDAFPLIHKKIMLNVKDNRFNILLYDFKLSYDKKSQYFESSMDMLIVFYSVAQINQMYVESKKEN